jgi:acyl carrier protein
VSASLTTLRALHTRSPAERLGKLAADNSLGIDPEDVRELDANFKVTIEWSAAGPQYFDAIVRPRATAEDNALPTEVADEERARALPPLSVDFATYANRPAFRTATGPNLVPTLRQHLRSSLPEYMIPSAFVPLEALPLTPNGKLDRQALPSPDRERQETATPFQPPATDVERKLAAVFRELLGLNEIGVDDNFFDLGANSLMMVRAVEKIRTELGIKLSLVRLFQFTTISSLGSAIAGPTDAEPGAAPGQNRGQLRREMMQRRRQARGTSETSPG